MRSSNTLTYRFSFPRVKFFLYVLCLNGRFGYGHLLRAPLSPAAPQGGAKKASKKVRKPWELDDQQRGVGVKVREGFP